MTDGTQKEGSVGLAFFSSSMALRAFARSSSALRVTSSSSSANLRFSPLFGSPAGVRPSGLLSVLPLATSNPACVSSNSLTALACASSSWRAFDSAASFSSRSRSRSALLISFLCAMMLLSAHSRQKMSPSGHATGLTADSRQSEQLPKGRKESLFSLADEEVQDDLARARSWAVKTGREVFLLPTLLAGDVWTRRFWGRVGVLEDVSVWYRVRTM